MPLTAEEEIELRELTRLKKRADQTGLSMEEVQEMEELVRGAKRSQYEQFGESAEAVIGQITQPIRNIPKVYEDIVSESRRGLESGSALDKTIGGLRLIGAPYEAPARALLGQPLGNIARNLGAPETAVNLIEDTTSLALEVLGPGFAGKIVRDTLEEFMPKFAPTPKIVEPVTLEEVEGVARNAPTPGQKVDEDLLQAEDGFIPRVSTDVTGDISEVAEQALKGDMEGAQRLYRRVTDKIALGEIDVTQIPKILEKHNLSPEDFAQMYRQTVRESAVTLQQLSTLSKRMAKVFEDNPEARKILDRFGDEVEAEVTPIGKGIRWWRSVENARRGMLVTQLATAVRNGISQVGRITIGSFEDALKGFFKGEIEESDRALNTIFAMRSRLSKQGRKRFDEIIESAQAAEYEAQLFSQPVHEVLLTGKALKIANYFNRKQEFFFRRIAFESKLRSRLQDLGLDYNTVNPNKIPDEVYQDSVRHAMEMTFAATPRDPVLASFIKSWSNVPGLTTINPFPRFAFGNALPFIIDHSPYGFIHALKPSVLKKLASGNSEEFATAASRATLGTIMLQVGMNMRNSEHAGEKWYEIQVGNKTIDMRPYAPLSTYLFLGELFTHPTNIKPKDVTEMMIGLNRIAGTGLMFVDILRGKTTEQEVKKTLAQFSGEYLSSFTVAARSLKDVSGQLRQEDALIRDARQDPFLGPTIKNFPFLSDYLPEKYSPLQVGTIERINPGLRQITGLSETLKTDIAKEVDRLQLGFQQIAPRTGIPEAENLMARYMAPHVKERFDLLRDNTTYDDMPEELQRLLLVQTVFIPARMQASQELQEKNPKLWAQVRAKKSVTRQELDVLDLIPEARGIREFIERGELP